MRIITAALLLPVVAGVMSVGCEPKGPPLTVQVPPPSARPKDGPEYDFVHKIRTGVDARFLARMRQKYIVAVARVGDNKPVGTPFVREDRITTTVTDKNGTAVTSTVVEGPGNPGISRAGREQLVSQLVRTKCFTVLERDSVNDIVRELDFGETKYVSKESRAKIGNLEGVRYIVNGGFTANAKARLAPPPVTPDNWVGHVGFPEGDEERRPIICRLRMYEVKTGVVVGVADGYGKSTQEALTNAAYALAYAVRKHELSIRNR